MGGSSQTTACTAATCGKTSSAQKIRSGQKISSAQKISSGQIMRVAEELAQRFSFSPVVMSLASGNPANVLQWTHAYGSENGRFGLIRLPDSVGALGKVNQSRRGILIQNFDGDIPKNEMFQYPIAVTEALKSLVCFPLLDTTGTIRIIVLCGYRFLHSMDNELCLQVQDFAARRFGLATCGQPPVHIHGTQQGFAFGELSKNLLLAQEAERKRISQELHDGISQEVLIAQMELRRLAYLPQDQWQASADKISRQLAVVMKHLSAMSQSLGAIHPDGEGLTAALSKLCKSLSEASGIRIRTGFSVCPFVDDGTWIGVYRIVQEALSNACKYSQARSIDVLLSAGVDALHVTVQDNGIGFDTSHIQIQGSGLGLKGMQERASLIGAQLRITSAPGQGTSISLDVPAGRQQ